MNALDFIDGQPWAIHPDALDGLIAVAERNPEGVRQAFARMGQDAGPEAVNAKPGEKVKAQPVRVRDGVAEIPVRGVISRYSTLFQAMCGGTSVEALATGLQAALDDPEVKAILLHVDSPGGQVAGTGEFAAMVRAACDRKPVAAYVGGAGCSAAYWIAAACDEVTCAPTSMLGSIGVMASYDTKSPAGRVVMKSSVSPMKNAGVDTESGKAAEQAVLDDLAAVFVGDVARYRGATPAQVASGYGRGGVMVGAAAVAAGMADAVGDFEAVHARLARGERMTKATTKTTPKPRPAMAAQTRGHAAMNPFNLLGHWWNNDPEAVKAAMSAEDAAGANPFASLKPPAPPKPEPPAVDESAIRAKIEAEVKAELTKDYEAKAAAHLREFNAGLARSFVAEQVQAGKISPADAPLYIGLYVDDAMSDHAAPLAIEGPGGVKVEHNRLDAFKAGFARRSKAGWTSEHVGQAATAFRGDFAGMTVLDGTAPSDPEAVARAAKSRDAMLAATPEGRAYLAERASK